MIIGIGSDIVYTKRFKSLIYSYGDRFTKRIFTEKEQAYAQSLKNSYNAYAKRFAAKEAFAKALGLGFRKGLKWKDIEVFNTNLGQPFISLSESGKKIIASCNISIDTCRIHLSLSDEKDMALAFVVIEKVES